MLWFPVIKDLVNIQREKLVMFDVSRNQVSPCLLSNQINRGWSSWQQLSQAFTVKSFTTVSSVVDILDPILYGNNSLNKTISSILPLVMSSGSLFRYYHHYTSEACAYFQMKLVMC
jgi:Cu/Ag efflux pump CusA